MPLWWLWRRGYWWVVGEDRVAEWFTFLVYLAASALSLVIAVRLSRHGHALDALLFGVLAAGMLFVAGEEVSWFQRQVGFSGPAGLVALNKQHEANLHNLLGREALHATYVGVALYGSLVARWLVPRLPLLRVRPWLYAPPASLAAWFGSALVYYGWAEYLNPVIGWAFGPRTDIEYLTGPKLQEVAELALAGGFLLFLLRIVYVNPDRRGAKLLTAAKTEPLRQRL